MHETRNFIFILLLAASAVWALVAWVFMGDTTSGLMGQRIVSTTLTALFAVVVVYVFMIEDKLPDRLAEVVGERYYEADGLSFMPLMRINHGQAELSLYYQNRYENPVHGVVHLRPPADVCAEHPIIHDLHFTFTAHGGAFGVIHQPIAVPHQVQGDTINVQVAAASYYPRSHGACLRKKPGHPCGTLLVDWAGGAFKVGVSRASNTILLEDPVTVHMTFPIDVPEEIQGSSEWKQEQLAAGVTT